MPLLRRPEQIVGRERDGIDRLLRSLVRPDVGKRVDSPDRLDRPPPHLARSAGSAYAPPGACAGRARDRRPLNRGAPHGASGASRPSPRRSVPQPGIVATRWRLARAEPRDPRVDVVVLDRPAAEQPLLGAPEPALVVAGGQVLGRLHLLADRAARTRTQPLDPDERRKREHAQLPRVMRRPARIRGDNRTEPVHPAHVVHPVREDSLLGQHASSHMKTALCSRPVSDVRTGSCGRECGRLQGSAPAAGRGSSGGIPLVESRFADKIRRARREPSAPWRAAPGALSRARGRRPGGRAAAFARGAGGAAPCRCARRARRGRHGRRARHGG